MKQNITLDVSKYKNKPRTVGKHADKTPCPFCDRESLRKDSNILEENGKMIWMQNKFPLLQDTNQTLVIETDTCEEDLTTYSFEYAKELFSFIFQKREEMKQTGKYKEVLLFKNHGELADASIRHAHMQLVGLEKANFDSRMIYSSTEGPIIYEDKQTKVTMSRTPLSEFYEFNIVWSKQDTSFFFVHWLQTILRFLPHFKEGRFQDYNLAFVETDHEHVLKIFPRKHLSVYFLGYGLKQVPNDLETICDQIRKFEERYS